MSQTKTMPEKKKAEKKYFGGGNRGLPLEPPFSRKHYHYIALRAEYNMSNVDMAAEVGVHKDTIHKWNHHRPFQEAVETKWLAMQRSNEALAQVVRNRVLVELERRTRAGALENTKKFGVYTLCEIMKTLRKELGDEHKFSFAFDLGGLTAGRATDIHRREAEEVARIQDLADETSDLGSFIASITGDRPVPATAPPGEEPQ